MKRLLLCLGVSLVAVGCASVEPSAEALAPAGQKKESTEVLVKGKKVDEVTLAKAKEIVGYRCTRVKKTGSRLGHRQCTTAKQREEAHVKAREFMQDSKEAAQIFVDPPQGQ